MAAPVPLIDIIPNQPTVASQVQGWLVSSAQNAGTTVTFTLTSTITGTANSTTATAIVDPSGAAVCAKLTPAGIGQQTLAVTSGTLTIGTISFNVYA